LRGLEYDFHLRRLYIIHLKLKRGILLYIIVAAAVLFATFTAQAATQDDFCRNIFADARAGQWFKNGQLEQRFIAQSSFNTQTGALVMRLTPSNGGTFDIRFIGECKANKMTLTKVGQSSPEIERLDLTATLLREKEINLTGKGSDGATYTAGIYPAK
jgi:hypothetical protein